MVLFRILHTFAALLFIGTLIGTAQWGLVTVLSFCYRCSVAQRLWVRVDSKSSQAGVSESLISYTHFPSMVLSSATRFYLSGSFAHSTVDVRLGCVVQNFGEGKVVLAKMGLSHLLHSCTISAAACVQVCDSGPYILTRKRSATFLESSETFQCFRWLKKWRTSFARQYSCRAPNPFYSISSK